MTDFFNDDRYPNRPDTPDFWRLASTVLKLDGRAAEEGDEGLNRTISEFIDSESLVYMAVQRALRASLDPKVYPKIAAAWLEAFLVGVNYAKETA